MPHPIRLRPPKTAAQRKAAHRKRLAAAGARITTVVIPAAVHAAMHELARKQGVSASAIVERALLALSNEDAS